MFWVKATAPDGTIYIGIVGDLNAGQVHRWLHINSSLPDLVEILSIPVISIPPGGISIDSIWGTGNLILQKTVHENVYTRDVTLDVNSGVPFMVDRWISGSPQFIFFPGINRHRYPPELRVRLPATLTQVGLLRDVRGDNTFRGGNNNSGETGSRQGGVT